MKLPNKYYNFRRNILKTIVPEFIWPKSVQIEDVLFKIRNTPYSFGTKRCIVRGDYELPERTLLRDQIIEGDVIIEMGGSIGVLTALLASKTGEKGFVVSVEASKTLTQYSKTWLEQDNVKVITGYGFPVFKLDDTIKVVQFDESQGSLGGSIRYEITERNILAQELSEDIYDISRISELYNLQPTILMIDVEGSENIILLQKPNFQKSIRTIIIELHPNCYTKEDHAMIIEKIVNEGFILKNQISSSYLFTRS